ncbi:MAG: glutamate--tRNA ligase [bacterium]|nr:glutamate--tRNA ligase [bacterium]
MIRTRYAPSPTGKPHVGNIRTAIFNFLQARTTNGKFILRIEDTDRERFVPEGVEYIEESLKWLGLEWDNEEKIHQSERLDIYKKYANQLLSEGKAYKCFCSKERLTELREEQTKSGKPPGYDACCRKLTKEDIEKLEKESKIPVIRFKIPETPKEVVWEDVVRGKVSIRTDIQEDFVIMKSDGYPTYHFASIVDDHLMEISTVIRGEEWIPSAPKHLLLYMAMGWEAPEFAHMPLIVGKDGKKLGKRNGDTAIMDYRENGYLADTMLNFLALLGWNDGTTQEIFTREELIKKFDLKRVGKAPAVFDIDRLNWINGEKIRALALSDLTKEVESFAPDFLKGKNAELLERALTVMQTRMVTLKDFTENSNFFFEDIKYKPEILVFGKSTPDASLKGLKGVLKALGDEKTINSADSASDLMKSVVEAENLSNGDVFWPVRVALSGQEKSPSPNEIMWALGKDKSIDRIKDAINNLEKS